MWAINETQPTGSDALAAHLGSVTSRYNLGAMPNKIVISDQPPYFLDLDAPTVPAYKWIEPESGTVLWVIRYRYCKRDHAHGSGEGHLQPFGQQRLVTLCHILNDECQADRCFTTTAGSDKA